MKSLKIHWQVIIAIFLAISMGYFFPNQVLRIDWIGSMFLDSLKMVVVPLVMSSIITGISGIGNTKGVGKLGLKTIVYYLSTSLIAILTGLLLVNLFTPGVGVNLTNITQTSSNISSSLSLADIIRGIIPSNLFKAMVDGNILPLIFFSLLFGFFMTKTEEKTFDVLSRFFNGLFEVMMKITMFIIKFTPIGVFALVSCEMAKNAERIGALAGSFGLYMIVVFLGLMIHGFVTLPLMIKLFAKRSPIKHFKNMLSALLTAFSTASSGATLPLTIDAVENKSGVSNRISSFTLPLGATINMDGTALYECVAVIFIAQVYGIELSFLQQIIVVFTALLVSIGAAGIPMAGLVMMTIILNAVNLPLEGVGLILAVDRFLDMSRTAINVWSDSCASVIIARSEKEELDVLRY